MEKLSSNWLTEGLNDFEYKKYLLLAYLQHANKRFDAIKLYPEMADLISHYRRLLHLKENSNQLKQSFPKELKEFDVESFQLKYRSLVEDDKVMQEVRKVMEYAEPKLKDALDIGKEIYEWIEDQLEVESVGLLPIYKKEGFLLFNQGGSKAVEIHRYALALISRAGDQFRALQTWFFKSDQWSLSRNMGQIKLDLINQQTELPNPAVFLIRSEMEFPLRESLLPVSKRLLVRDFLS